MKRILLLAAALVLLAPTARPQAVDKSGPMGVRRCFEREDSSHADRMQALERIDGLDNEAAAKALAYAHASVHQEITGLEARRFELNRELDQNLMARKGQKLKGGVRGARQGRKRLRKESFKGRARLDSLRIERRAIEERTEALSSERALRWLMKNVVLKTKRGIGIRLASARAISQDPDAAETFDRALLRAKSTVQICVLLEGLRARGPAGEKTFNFVLKQLSHDDACLRELAARTLAAQARPESINPLIDYLAATSGQMQKRAAKLLEELTGQELGLGAASWRAWLQANSDDPLHARGKAKPSSKRQGKARGKKKIAPVTGTYMGIPQDGDSIVYLLDASASMNVKVDFDLPGTSTQDQASRLDACKTELKRALRALHAPTKFSIVYFHETAGHFRNSPTVASPENIAAACAFVTEIKPLFATNTYDGFLEAFALLAPAQTKEPIVFNSGAEGPLGQGIDTIFLMTDGRPVIFDPTKNGQAGAKDSLDTILAAIRDWDPLRRVTVHCIGIGKGIAKNKMRKLAQACDGEARFY